MLASNSLYYIPKDGLDPSAFQVLGLQAYFPKPGLWHARNQTLAFLHARQIIETHPQHFFYFETQVGFEGTM